MKAFVKKIFVAGILASGALFSNANAANPDKGFLVINTVALHFENFDDRNAITPGFGWEYSPSSKIGWHGGTLSDSFGYQSFYGGINYATQPLLKSKLRFMIGATVLHKQFHENSEPETKLVPLPAMEVKLTKRAVLNVSGSPQVDYGEFSNNAVMFFQLKIGM